MIINFYLAKQSNKATGTAEGKTSNRKGENLIRCYIRGFGKKRTIILNTDFHINPKYWNKEKQEVRKSFAGSPEMNANLAKFKEDIFKEIDRIRIKNNDITFDELKEELKTAMMKQFFKEEQTKNFFEVFNEFLELKTDLSIAIKKKYNSLANHLKAYQATAGFKISFEKIDMYFYDTFLKYLYEKANLTNNTASKYFDMLKTFLNWSAERGFNHKTDYKKFKTKEEKVDTVYLTEEELFSIYEFDLKNNPALERARDVFCFACFTGARFSDVAGLKRADIIEDTWHLRVAKTNDILQIPLNNFAKNVLARYSESPKPLPVISSQKTNIHIKEVCSRAGINQKIKITKYIGTVKKEEYFEKHELVSFHTARRTFVTLSLENGMRPEVLMQITGHKDYKNLKKYIKISDNIKKAEMINAWNKPKLKLA